MWRLMKKFFKFGDRRRIMMYVYFGLIVASIVTQSSITLIFMIFVWLDGIFDWMCHSEADHQNNDSELWACLFWPLVVLAESRYFGEEGFNEKGIKPENRPTYCNRCRKQSRTVEVKIATCCHFNSFPDDSQYHIEKQKYCPNCDSRPRQTFIVCIGTSECPYKNCLYR